MATIADMLNGIGNLISTGATDTANWISERARKSAEAARQATGITDEDSVLDIARKTNATDIIPKSQSNVLSPIIPDVAASIPAALPNLAGLIGKGVGWGVGKIAPDTGQAISDAANVPLDFAKSITDPVDKVTDAIAGGKLNRSLIDGDLTDLVGSWSRLGANVLTPAPAIIANKIDEGLKVLNASKSLIAQTGAKALTGLEVLSPVMLRTPTNRVAGTSLGIAGGLGVGLELAFPDPNKEKLDEEARNATTVAMDSAKDTAPAVEVGQEIVNPVYAGIPSTGNGWLDATIGGIASLALLAGYNRQTTQRVLEAMGKATGFNHTNVIDVNSARKDVFGKLYPGYEVHNANRIDAASGAAVATKMSSFMQYGEMPGSTIRPIMPPKDLMQRAVATGKMDQLGEVLNARAELDFRKLQASKNLKLGTPGSYGTTLTDLQYQNMVRSGRINEADTAHNYSGVRSGDDLVRVYNAGMADPEVAQLVRAYDDLTKKMVDYRVEQRNINLAEANKIKAESPLLAPTKLEKGTHFDNVQKSVGTGSVEPTNPMAELPHFIEDTIRMVEGNKRVAFEIEALRAKADAGDPFAKKLLGRRDVKNVRDADKRSNNFVTYRDRNGVVRNQEILDENLLRGFRNSGQLGTLTAMQGAHPVLSATARALESGATGLALAATGSPFSFTTGFYNALFGSVFADRTIGGSRQYRGYIDKAFDKAGLGGFRGDLTLVPDMMWRTLTGVQALSAKRLGDALHSSVITDGMMSNVLGAKNAEDFANSLREHYKKNWTYQLQQAGVQGPGGMGTALPKFDPEGSLKAASGGMLRRTYYETEQFLRNILQTISASPGASIWMMNQHLHPDLRAAAVRDFAGDLSRSGAYEGVLGKGIGGLTAATPWGNVYLQSMDKFLRGINTPKKAFEAAVGATNAIGIPAIGLTLWNMAQGQEYVEHDYLNRSPDRKASSLYMALPGQRPEAGIEIPIEPTLRPYMYAVKLLAGHMLGVSNGEIFADGNEGLKNAFAEMYSRAWKEDVPLSVVEQSVLPPVPPALTALAAAGGINVRSYLNAQSIHRRNDAGYTTSTARSPFSDFMGMQESAVTENVIRALGGTAADLAYRMYQETARRVNEGGAKELVSNETLGRNIQHLTLNASDSFKWGPSPVLFGSFQAVSPAQEASGKLVSEKLKGLDTLSKSFQAVTTKGAVDSGEVVGNKKAGYQLLLGGKLAVEPNDPRMLVLGQLSQRLQRDIGQLQALNKEDYQQRNSIQTGTKYSPEERRYQMNRIGDNIIHRDRQMLLYLQQYEAQVSDHMRRNFGYTGPTIKLDKMNINKGLEQFK